MALAILRTESSLRGLAATRGVNREVFRQRFHRSLMGIKPPDPARLVSPDGPLIAIIDGLWFRYRGDQVRYCCYTILIRPLSTTTAVVVGMTLRRGPESRGVWERLFDQLPVTIRKRIVAVVSDGFRGVEYLAADRGWQFQCCQVHLKRKVAELRGVRHLPGQTLRQQVTRAVHRFLNTPDVREAAHALDQIHRLFAHPDCPRTIRTRLVVLLRDPYRFRACWMRPELNLPASTNSVECVHGALRRLLTRVRGFATPKQLRYWIRVFHTTMPTVTCRGVRDLAGEKHSISLS